MTTISCFPKCNLLLHQLSSELLREKKKEFFSVDSDDEFKVNKLFRVISLPCTDNLSGFITILKHFDCVEYVECKDLYKIIVWINIETEYSKDSRPFHHKSGIFAIDKKDKHTSYPVEISKVNELMTTGIFNIYDKIIKIEILDFALNYNKKTFIPYLICLEEDVE